jgi:alcohol dehydrogenase (cytochrome c)
VDLPSWSGAMVTAGGLVFTGNTAGDFAALDEATGKVLWQFKTPSGVNSAAHHLHVQGKQYVSIFSVWAAASARRETAGKVLPPARYGRLR